MSAQPLTRAAGSLAILRETDARNSRRPRPESLLTSEKVGTVGLAYAVHKAASPIRFPPTVALTPVVARTLFGKNDDDDASADEAAE